MKSSFEQFTHTILKADEEARLGRITRDFPVDSKEYSDACLTLIEHNLRLVAKEATNFSKKTSISIQDLMSEGYLGLVYAISKYDPDKNNNARFATYATYWIQQKIRLYIARNSVAHVPNYLIQHVVKYKKLISDDNNKNLSRKEIMEKLEINSKTLTLVQQANISSRSLEFVIAGESLSKEVKIIDTLREENIKNPDIEAIDNDKTFLIQKAISELSPIDRDIITSQFIDSNKITLFDIGVKYNLSAERIRQLKEKALGILKEKLKDFRFEEKLLDII